MNLTFDNGSQRNWQVARRRVFSYNNGQVVHTTPNFNASVTLGLDASGNPTGCPGANPYYMRVTWTGAAGNTRSVLLPY